MRMLGEHFEVYEAPQLKLYINMSPALSQHRRMNLQHAVQHSLNISLVKLHTNKPVGTHELTPTPACFDIIPARVIRIKSQINMFICICGCWKRAHYICVNSE